MNRLTQMEDQECVALCLQGEREAFSELVGRYQNRIYRFILRMTGGREEALELTQDTFLKAYQGLAGWQPDALFRTWLFRIASNTAMDSLRRRKVVQYVPLGEDMDFPDHGETPEAQLQRSERYGILASTLQQLPNEYREILLLREIEEMSYSDIAQALDLREGTVKSRIARARMALIELCKRKHL